MENPTGLRGLGFFVYVPEEEYGHACAQEGIENAVELLSTFF